MAVGSAITNINIYGDVTGTNVAIGNNNTLGASHAADATHLPTFDKDAPLPQPGDLPVGSHLPFSRNPLFTGREADLHAIAELLLNQNAGAVIKQAVTGMGGLGKTQLAVEFGYRFGRFFRGVHWLNMANPESINSEIAACGVQMGLPDFPDDLPSQVILTVNTWKAHGPRLLILDNFEEVGLVNQVMRHFNHSNLRVLLTSRRSDWSLTMGLNPISLEVFSKDESLAFLKKSQQRRKDADEELALLSERLGYLPLALELASRYLNGHPRLKVAEYLEQIAHALEHPSMQGWRTDLPALTEHDLSLMNTFALSWQALKDETAQAIFMSAGYLAPNEPIPFEIFEGALEIASDVCDEALGKLFSLGLLRREEDALPAIHPLLAEYARSLAQENLKILEALADTLGTLSNEANNTGLPARFDSIKPHIPVLAIHAENKKIGSVGTLWNNYGCHLNDIADYSGARAAYERALKIDEAAFGPDHPDVAIDVNNLGGVMQDLGDLVGARAAYERALKIDEAAFGPDHPNVAIRVNNLGSVMKALGNLVGARAAYERALKIDEAAFGPDHPKVAIRVNNLGSVMKDLGDLVGARAAYERALRIDEAAFGPDHPNVARDVNNLGMVMKALGDLVGARAAYERALKIFKKFLPPDHPNIKIVQGNLDSLG